MFCPKCGTSNSDNAAFCCNCGGALEQKTPSSPWQTAPSLDNSYANTPDPKAEVTPEPVYTPPQPTPQPTYTPPQPTYTPPQPANNGAPTYVVVPATPVPGKGLGIAGMILGIISLLSLCFFPIAVLFAIIGIILSIVGVAKAKGAGKGNGCGVAGIVCSAITLFFLVGFFLLFFAGVEFAEDLMDEIEDMFRISARFIFR